MTAPLRDLQSVRRITVTEVRFTRGAGVEGDPVREIVACFDDDGHCLAEHDPVFPTPWYAPTEACRERRGWADDAWIARALAVLSLGHAFTIDGEPLNLARFVALNHPPIGELNRIGAMEVGSEFVYADCVLRRIA